MLLRAGLDLTRVPDGGLAASLAIARWEDRVRHKELAHARIVFDPGSVQGTAAIPYLEAGTVTRPEVWQRLQRTFGGQFFGFAVWFN